jgi:hypothetical protein
LTEILIKDKLLSVLAVSMKGKVPCGGEDVSRRRTEGRQMKIYPVILILAQLAVGGSPPVFAGQNAAPSNAPAANAPGVTDTEIKIGQTMPYTGPLSGYGTIGRQSSRSSR